LKEAIILFAHGSRERAWARPLEQLAASLAKKFRGSVRLAFLEQMQPSLEQAIARLAEERMRSVRVVPVFLGPGGHVKDDLPKILDAARKQHPDMELSLDAPIGEQPAVIEAIAAALIAKK
jgi:sirohydrochlorin cobaltochelatase